jgi:hypothetical protein
MAAPTQARAVQVIDGLKIPRAGHTATRLPDGNILVVGGENGRGPVCDAEIYDPASRSFSVGPALMTARTEHTATRLQDGRVLVVGGRTSTELLSSSEIYDPASRSFSPGPVLDTARAGHTATPLPDGRIVVVGGDSEGSVEVFDPRISAFMRVEARLAAARRYHAAALLLDGTMLIAGGNAADGSILSSAELLDSRTMTFSPDSPSMRSSRSGLTLRVLPDGKVQAIGGDSEGTMELFNVEGRYFTARAHLLGASGSLSTALRNQTRAAVIGRRVSAKFLADDVSSTDLLDRSDYSLTELPGLDQALAAGGTRTTGGLHTSAALYTSSTATVTTDKTDYHPGETVLITGTGWQPGETVSLNIHRDTNDPPDTVLTTVADASGNIQDSDYVVQDYDLGVSFLLTATGLSSGYTAQTTFTDSGNFDYSPSSQTLSATVGGSAVSFTQSVTAPKNNGSFTASLQVAGTGANPIPTSWVSSSPASLSFVTTSSAGDTKTWDVSFTVPSGTATGAYTAQIKANASIGGVGVGPGTAVTLNVTGCSAPTITTCAASQQASAGATCNVAVPDFTATTVVSSPGCTPTVTQSPTAGTLVGLGSTTVTITAMNSSGTATCTTSFTVSDTTAPTITLAGSNPMTVECHTTYTEPGATAHDTCAGDFAATPSGNVNVNTPGSYTITYNASDLSGNAATPVTRTVNVVDTTAPTINLAGSNPMTVECHTTYTEPGATAHDTCAGDFAATPSGNVNVNTPGSYTITYNASDLSGNAATPVTRTVNVRDTSAPAITIIGDNPATVICHTSYTDAGATALDACAGVLTATPSGIVNVNAVGPYTITYTATDPAGNTSTATRTVNVTNVAPSVDSVTGPTAPVAVNTAASVTATFTDPDPGQAHTCTFTWDDGSTSTVTANAGDTSCTLSHIYSGASVNTVSVNVSDYCADGTGIFKYVVVYDPNAGFVTGGGWINSPAGAYVAGPSLTGKANFGFVSKYQKGAKVPTGETEFQFQVASFNFHSSAYEWLVISGAKAQYKGTGTVNGAGNFGFLLTATDSQVSGGGGVDKFRIKIWDKANGDTVVYDNVSAAGDDIDSANPQEIAGGSIVIHSK